MTESMANRDVKALVRFSEIMGELSNEGKTELMEQIWLFIKTGDKSLLQKK